MAGNEDAAHEEKLAAMQATIAEESNVGTAAPTKRSEGVSVSQGQSGAKRKESGSPSSSAEIENQHPNKRRAAVAHAEASGNSGDDNHDPDKDGDNDSDNTDYGEDDDDDDNKSDDVDDNESVGEGDEHVDREQTHLEDGEVSQGDNTGDSGNTDPPLPPGPPPGEPPVEEDDGWQAIWDEQHLAYYFYNAKTGESTWTNPRVPEASSVPAPGVGETYAGGAQDSSGVEAEGPTFYQLAHGITDPNAVTAEDIANSYGATGRFNRFTGKWQSGDLGPERHNDENKSKRQMEFYFDVDAAANSHDGRSLKAERQMKKLSKKELKMFREKRKEKKEQKRRAWLKD